MDDCRLRVRIYRSFLERGRAPTVAELTTDGALRTRDVEAALDRLAGAHEIALVPDTYDIWMAHPFSSVPTSYRVTVGARAWWANCAWDAVAIPGLVGDATVHVRSPVDGTTWEARVDARTVTPDHLIHFTVPARRFWDDIGLT